MSTRCALELEVVLQAELAWPDASNNAASGLPQLGCLHCGCNVTIWILAGQQRCLLSRQ